MLMKNLSRNIFVFIVMICLSSCSAHNREMETVEYLDIERFMGDWYVIANIPTFLEKDIFNAIEKYTLDSDGTIQTEFSFNKGGFDGERKTYKPRGFIKDTNSNALWGMQFIWPIKADFRVVYVATDYSYTIIARNKRDYVWLMARNSEMDEETYSQAVNFIQEIGYDIDKIVKVPHQWQK